jgi:hypothetical protein
MFDYQAGEKYKLTLIMVALAGVMAGAFFTVLFSAQSEPPKSRQQHAYQDPDLRGDVPISTPPGYASYNTGSPAQANGQMSGAAGTTDPLAALNLVQEWLPLAWDLSAGTASDSQEKAIKYMTGECAQAYRQNVWTPDTAKQINASGIKSSFNASRVAAGNMQPDGSVVITVEGKQVLDVPSKGSKTRQVKLEYLVKNTADGLRIAGISEAGKS